MDGIRWGDPQQQPGRRLQIWRPQAGLKEWQTLVLVSDKLVHTFEHWLDDRTRTCLENGCPGCGKVTELRYAYAHAVLWIGRSDLNAYQDRLLQLTRAAAGPLAGRAVRGQVIKLRRPGKERNSRVEVDLGQVVTEIAGQPLPEPANVRRILVDELWQLPRSVQPRWGREAI